MFTVVVKFKGKVWSNIYGVTPVWLNICLWVYVQGRSRRLPAKMWEVVRGDEKAYRLTPFACLQCDQF